MNKGMSLLEVTIGMALFSILMVLVVETTVSIRDFSANYEEMTDLEEEGRRIIKQVTTDFSNSAWYNNAGNTFPVATDISQETYGNTVRFLRLRSNGSDLSQTGIAPVDFKTPISLMSEWKDPKNTVPGLVVNPVFELYTNNVVLLSQVWEPIERLRATPLPFGENKSLANLRIYEYRVESSANDSLGRGVLKRRYSEDEGVTWNDDASIGDLGRHIYWFIIQPDLRTQQVRLFLELRGPDQQVGKTVAVRRFSVTIAMRSVEPSN